MGNCLKIETSVSWVGDEWMMNRDLPEKDGRHKDTGPEGKTESCEKNFVPSKEVKIKITKKQWKELIGKVEGKGLTIDQLLSQLMSLNDGDQVRGRNRPWKPALQSIPETN